MSHTEAEAKTKWCPFYRVATSGGDESTYEVDNRSTVHENTTPEEQNPRKQKWVDTGQPIPQSCCIGSRCMAWQWSSSPYQCVETDLGQMPPDDGSQWSPVRDKKWCPNCGQKRTDGTLHYYKKVEVRDGFCGLTAREGRFVK